MVNCLPLALALLAAVPASRAAAGEGLTVAAAANLGPAVAELKGAFEAARPGVAVSVTLGASGTFFAQIQNGAPFDLFLSADREYPARLVAAGLGAAADERVYAYGRLAVWLPPGSTLPIERDGLAALADPRVKAVAMANPAVAPFGRASEAALRSARVEDAVRPKRVLGTSVAQAAHIATTGAADAALLPYSLVLGEALAHGQIYLVPESLYPRIEQSGLVLSAARDPALARAFLAFVAGPAGRSILARHGYGLP